MYRVVQTFDAHLFEEMPMSAPALPRHVTTVPGRRDHLRLVGPGFVPTAPVPGPARPPTTTASSHPATRRAQSHGPAAVRLTPRGRAVRGVLVLMIATLLAIGAGAWAGSQQRAAENRGAVEVVGVGTGQTLWGIADDLAGPRDDVRDVVHRIQELNEMSGGDLVAGQRLLVPAG